MTRAKPAPPPERNQYDSAGLFAALDAALASAGIPTVGLTPALARRWRRTPLTVYRYRTARKRLPVALAFDLVLVLSRLGETRSIEVLVTCDETIDVNPSELFKALRKSAASTRTPNHSGRV